MASFSETQWRDYHRCENGSAVPMMRYAKELDSTNEEARRWIVEGCDSGSLVVADFQTAGRGRRGNKWTSKAGEGLLFSLIIEHEGAQQSRLAIVAAEAMARVVEKDGVPLDWKWPNDLYLAGAKVSGVLVEVVGDWAIVGLGINVGGIRAGQDGVSLAEVTGLEMQREKLLAGFYGEFFRLASLCNGYFEEVMKYVRRRCMLTGKEVTLDSAGQKLEGVVLGIASDGALMLQSVGKTTCIYDGQNVRLVYGC